MPKNLNQTFEALRMRYISTIERDYKQRYKKARDKDLIKTDLKKEVGLIVGLWHANQEISKLIDTFHAWYDRGEEVDKTFAYIRKTYGEDVTDIRPFRRIENGKKITLYISEEEKALKALALNDRKLFKFLIRETAYREIQRRLPSMFGEELNNVEPKKPAFQIKWTGEKGNKNEFVQLVYSLHKAGLINNGKGEITKIVEVLAEIFSLELGNNWQSNLSSSIHKAKFGSSPEVFSKIQDAYENYVKELVEHKRRTK